MRTRVNDRVRVKVRVLINIRARTRVRVSTNFAWFRLNTGMQLMCHCSALRNPSRTPASGGRSISKTKRKHAVKTVLNLSCKIKKIK